ncbi:MAG: CHAT domain-containing protein [Elainellaceae cyanobacterium]
MNNGMTGVVIALTVIGWTVSVQAQVTPAADGTNTQVTQEGDRFLIRGGQRSQDGANLFHRFDEFGLDAGQRATFRTPSTVQNVLGRVVGGDASVVDGLLRVSGSSANLWLINPAGIIFGPNARLDIGGSFTATTATSLGFGDRWLTSTGLDYANLVGTPTALAFTGDAATLINAGRLAVPAGESLMLAGGVVINTGDLIAPGGQVSIVAVPEQQVVRVGQAGQVLSLELETADQPGLSPSPITPLTLPELLTDPSIHHATGVMVDADGTVRLVGSGVALPITGGTAIASGSINTANVTRAPHHPEVNILGDRVGLVGAQIDASGRQGGGTIRIGGDYQGQGSVFTSQRTVVDASSRIWADAIAQGDGGRVMIWSDDTTSFAGDIWARGGRRSGDGGLVEVSGLQTLQFLGQVNTLAPRGRTGTLLLDPTNIIVAEVGLPGALVDLDGVDELADPDSIVGAPGVVSDYSQIAPSTLAAATTNIILQATDSIFFNEAVTIPTNGVGLRAEAGGNIEVNAALTTTNGAIALIAGDAIQVNQPMTSNGGAVTLAAGGVVNVFNGFNSGGGDIQISSDAIANVIAPLQSEGGDVTISTDTQLNMNAPLISDGGTVNLTADQDGDGLGTLTVNVGINTGAGDLVLTGSEIDLNAALQGQGSLQLRPSNAAQDIILGGAGALSLNLDLADLNVIQDGFSEVIIGREDGRGTIQAAQDLTFNNALTLQAGGAGGSIDTSGFAIVSNNAVTFAASGDITTGDMTTAQAPITLESLQGAVDTSGGAINTGLGGGRGDRVSINAVEAITTGNITTAGGQIDLTSRSGSIDTSGGPLNSLAPNGNGGAIALSAADDITSGALTLGSDNGGNPSQLTVDAPGRITLNDVITANGAAIRIGTTTAPSDLTLSGTLTDSGDMEVVADTFRWQNAATAFQDNSNLSIRTRDNLQILGNGDIRTNGGAVSFTSQGSISIDPGLTINTLGRVQDGAVAIAAQGTITTGAVASGTSDLDISSQEGRVSTGDLESQGGAIAVVGEAVQMGDIRTGGGDLTVTSRGNLTTSAIDAQDGRRGGAIALAATNLRITDDLSTNNSPISLDIDGNLRLVDATIATGGGQFSLESDGALRILGSGAIATNGNDLRLVATNLQISEAIELSTAGARSGNLFLQATTGNLTAGDLTTAGNQGGDITAIARQDLILGNLDASGTGSGGRITATSETGALTVGNLDTSGSQGGDINLNAITTLRTGSIRSRGMVGDGGNVTIDPIDVVVDWIDAQGGNAGRGGNVDITASNTIRITGSFIDDTGLAASIATGGGAGGGNITLRHGGNGIVPFIVGDASTNGSAAVLSSRTFTIDPDSFLFTYQEGEGAGRIRIVSVPQPVDPEPPGPVDPEPPGPVDPEPPGPVDPNDPSPTIAPPEQDVLSPLQTTDLSEVTLDTLTDLETFFTEQYVSYLSLPEAEISTLEEIQDDLRVISDSVGVRPAVVYAVFTPPVLSPDPLQELETLAVGLNSPNASSDRLEIVLVTQEGQPIRVLISDATRERVATVARQFYLSVTDSSLANTRLYQAPAQQLYSWLIEPIEAELEAQGIQHISFVLDGGLRSLPMAALYDGDRFLIENYSVGLMPSLSLTDNRYVSLQNLGILAMGASEFPDQEPLPAVPTELNHISSVPFLNEDFTPEDLRRQRQRTPYGIIHLATHGEFLPGGPGNSYIQFWDGRLGLDGLRSLGLNNPPVELMVLSACRTALGDSEAELGFAGLAIQAGVNSAIASLWYVSDLGTLALMSEFYDRVGTTSIRADALRQAQLAMLRGEVVLQDGQLQTTTSSLDLPSSYQAPGRQSVSHPYYWSSFTIIGSPW